MTPDERDILTVYIGQFSARTDGYVRDSRVHIPEDLTVDVAEEAFTVGSSISGYMARGRETHIGAIDFDTDDGLDRARAVRAFLAVRRIPALVVSSRRGAHLWITGEWMDLQTYRRALKHALVLSEQDHEKAEIFPKTGRAAWGSGALRMPLMRHPKTGVRYPAYGPKDEPLDNLHDTLMAFDQAAVGALRAFAPPLPPLSPRRQPPVALRPRWASTGDEPAASSLLQMMGLTALPGRSARCPFHDDQHASLSIADDDMRVFCKAPECLLYNEGTGVGSIALEALIRKGSHAIASPAPHGDGIPDHVP